MKPRVLLVDDEPAIWMGLSWFLTKSGYEMKGASTLREARAAYSAERFDAILLDLNLPDGSGLDEIAPLRERCPDMAILVITGHGDIPLAVEAMRRGADNFLTKPVDPQGLGVCLRKSLEVNALRRESMHRARLTRRVDPYFGESDAMRKVVDMATLASGGDASVLLLGETGTGKGMIARWIHEHSARSSGSYVEVNCSALRGELLASELFGHVKGAFTTAVADQTGLVEVADGGTLFLDEILDMAPGVQAQMLKVIEEKRFRRLGDVEERRSDFRLICATNRSIDEEARRGEFRQDLYFRVSVFPIQLPALRSIYGDLAGLVGALLTSLGAAGREVKPEVLGKFLAYHWPGNIRELRNVLERALVLARGQPLGLEHFPGLSGLPNEGWNLEGAIASHMKATVEHFGGDVRKAAAAMGTSVSSVYRKMRK
jgi:DNA-binding NtrC family response regulator